MLNAGGRKPEGGARRDAALFVYTDDVDSLYSNMSLPADVAPPEDSWTGLRQFFVCDLDGNEIVFATRLSKSPTIVGHHYVLAVPDLDRTADWFVRVLGCERDDVDPGNWTYLRLRGVTFMVGRCPDALPPAQLGDHGYFAYLIVTNLNDRS